MSIRQCPDCGGKGRYWRREDQRLCIWTVPVPPNQTADTGIRTKILPEYYDCELCGGKGRIECQRIAEAKE